jgi:hypothetical protein
MRDSTPAIAVRPEPKKKMPPHLRIVENDFLKPGVRNPSGRNFEQDSPLSPGVANPHDDWE